MKKTNFLLRLCLCLTLILSTTSIYAQLGFGKAELFNDGWLFEKSDHKHAHHMQLNDNKWRKLTLPHDWSVEQLRSPSYASCMGFFPGGIAWYRKHFRVTDDAQQYHIYFEGVYNRSEVYLNGQLLGRRPSGYVSFAYDLTPYLNKDGDNLLAVRVDHSLDADSRWYTGSGIYRDVYLVKSGDTHFAQWGVGYKATAFKGSTTDLEIDFQVEGKDLSNLYVENILRDAQGKVVASSKSKVKGDQKQLTNLKVRQTKRWTLDNPYLYELETILTRKGKTIDQTTTTVGLRQLDFDSNKGFALNGEWMKVKGVCLHHDAGVLGAVVPEAVWRRRLNNLKAIGVNAIRMSHNPQAQVVYDLCDELGLLVMDEAFDEFEFPKRKWIEGWNKGVPGFQGTYDYFDQWSSIDVVDQVKRNRHHPSIFMWSIGNEVDYPNDPYSHPVLDGGAESGFTQPAYGGYKPDAPSALRIGYIAQRLADCVRTVDTSRPTTGALAGVIMSNETAYPQAVDVVGYNYTESRYAKDHEKYPNRIIYGSENRSDYKAWTYVRDLDYIFGQFIWTGTDYLGESGRWPSRGLGTGLLDFASFPKGRGHFRASLWAEKPVMFVGTYPKADRLSIDALDQWNYSEGDMIRAVCYTNAPQARLMLNGKQVGKVKPYDLENGIIYWDLPFQAGELTAEGLDKNGNVVSTYKISTSGRPYALRATLLDDFDPTATLAHVMIEVVDENGVAVKLADNQVSCQLQGNAKLLGLENGFNDETSPTQAHARRAHQGKLLAYIALNPRSKSDKPATVRFSSPLLQGCELVLQ